MIFYVSENAMKTCTVVFFTVYPQHFSKKNKKNWLQNMFLESDIWEQEVF